MAVKVDSIAREELYWIVVADESRAIIYTQATKHSPLQKSFTLKNELAQEKMADLISDRGGRSFDSHGHGRHTLTREKAGPKKQAALAFAKEIAARIIKAKHDGSCRDFALIVAPKFLGILRNALVTAGSAAPFLTIDKEVVSQDIEFIEKLLGGG